ncbi:MAG: TetR/AcrR family transcriptional regulator [Pseudomonadota bacterium]
MSSDTDARKRYIALATVHFSERGFNGASLAQIAEQAGVSKQALLHFFKSKEQLYESVLEALAARLLRKVQDTKSDKPDKWLSDYFDQFSADAMSDPVDARLVLRALLDSQAGARRWPLKAYLDALVAIAERTRRWNDAPVDELLADLYYTIGAVLCAAVSLTALQGMYGSNAVRHFSRRHLGLVAAAL